MQKSIKILENTLKELENLKKLLNRKKISYVNTQEEKIFIKATVYSWLNSHRPKLANANGVIDFSKIDNDYDALLNYSDSRTKRSLYITSINNLKSNLIGLRSEIIDKTNSGKILSKEHILKPNFSSLVSNSKMISILENRWMEIENCLSNNAPFAATVMMGGLLESVFLTKINTFEDKKVLFEQRSTPKNGKTKKPKQLSEWMLKDFIDVSSEIKLITKPAANFSRYIMDYRNYIHPEKELRKGESIKIGDAELFWKVTISLINQLLK